MQVADAAGCDGLRVGFEIEDLDGDVAGVGPVFEGFEEYYFSPLKITRRWMSTKSGQVQYFSRQIFVLKYGNFV